jgi:exopolysaccharide production protein ExoQ
MPPQVATLAFVILVTGFFLFDRDRKARTSPVLWVPALWLMINGSRSVSMWLGMETESKLQTSAQYLDGNPVDKWVYFGLILIGLGALFTRKTRVAKLLRRNGPILLFFFYCAFSSLWSDYPEVSIKRWIKAAGDLVMVLVVLTDLNPFAALKQVLSRVGFILVPASVLLIKYYPALGRIYNIWTWEPMFVGVAEHKNTLGLLCMVLGLGFEWCFLIAYRDRDDKQRSKRLLVYATLLGMTIWLFIQANSMTSLSCFLLGSLFLWVSGTRIARRQWATYLLMAVMVAVPFATLFMGMGGVALAGMGRDATLTGRTEIWKDVLSMAGNPVIGTGFESFWLGERADRMWKMFYFHPTQAHNGYIEIYLELGWVGIALMALIIVTGCRNAVAMRRWDPVTARIRMAFIVIALAYNMTEAGFRMMTLTWFFFLLSAVIVPKAVRKPSTLLQSSSSKDIAELQLQGLPVPDFAGTI